MPKNVQRLKNQKHHKGKNKPLVPEWHSSALRYPWVRPWKHRRIITLPPWTLAELMHTVVYYSREHHALQSRAPRGKPWESASKRAFNTTPQSWLHNQKQEDPKYRPEHLQLYDTPLRRSRTISWVPWTVNTHSSKVHPWREGGPLVEAPEHPQL